MRTLNRFIATGIIFLTFGPPLPASGPSFEVATMRPVQRATAAQAQMGLRTEFRVDAARVDIRRMSIGQLIRFAYNVKPYQVSGPPWLDTARYDISATLPVGAKAEQVPAMLRNLLTERLRLAAHTESRDSAVYSLVVAKGGPKLKKAEATADNRTDSAVLPPGSPKRGQTKRTMLPGDVMHMEISNVTMPELAELLSFYADRPVIDETKLDGDYQLVLDISQQELRARAGAIPPVAGLASNPGGNSLFASLEKLGLRLKPQKSPIKTLVVDHIERIPAEN